ncbi:DNA replication complex GINS protein-like protein psf3 [Dipodascopsis tothii]|uniref:DNA replication complex GINS protein-like protein psf3 n=1 Tax=Dipodascopsis tothii TaxID=44089 RepID=UPI0034CF4B3D
MANKYYSLDDILTDGQKVPVTFNLTVPGMGYLDDNSTANAPIKEGTRLELPLWMAEILAISGVSEDTEDGFVTLGNPPQFANKVLNALKSDATSVDLRSQSAMFYRLAERWLSMVQDDDLATVLLETLKKRAAELRDHAHNPRSALIGDQQDFLGKLDETEVLLFRTAHDSSKEFKSWLNSVK